MILILKTLTFILGTISIIWDVLMMPLRWVLYFLEEIIRQLELEEINK